MNPNFVYYPSDTNFYYLGKKKLFNCYISCEFELVLQDNVRASFDLNNLYIERKNNPIKVGKKKDVKEISSQPNGLHEKSE